VRIGEGGGGGGGGEGQEAFRPSTDRESTTFWHKASASLRYPTLEILARCDPWTVFLKLPTASSRPYDPTRRSGRGDLGVLVSASPRIISTWGAKRARGARTDIGPVGHPRSVRPVQSSARETEEVLASSIFAPSRRWRPSPPAWFHRDARLLGDTRAHDVGGASSRSRSRPSISRLRTGGGARRGFVLTANHVPASRGATRDDARAGLRVRFRRCRAAHRKGQPAARGRRSASFRTGASTRRLGVSLGVLPRAR